MDIRAPKDVKEIYKRLQKVNNRTKNKIDVLQDVLRDYDNYCSKLENFKGFSVRQLIDDISRAKIKRKNVSKRYLHQEFLRIKELADFRIRHTPWS